MRDERETIGKAKLLRRLAREYAKRHKADKVTVNAAIDMMYEFYDLLVGAIVDETNNGRKVVLSGFGTFDVRDHAGHKVHFGDSPDGMCKPYRVLHFCTSYNVNNQLRSQGSR